MTVTVVSTVIHAPAEQVWPLLADFTGWHHWLPRVVTTTMDAGGEAGQVGSVRDLELSDGSHARERLVLRDDKARELAYEFAGPAPFAVRRYVGRVRVEHITVTGWAFVHWSGDFDADEADEPVVTKIFSTIYVNFLGALDAAATAREDTTT